MFLPIAAAISLLACEIPDTLQMSAVTAGKNLTVSHTDTVYTAGFNDVTEALSMIPSLYVNDYGGTAGLKNVSLRGLGTSSTSIYFDGIRISNVQSGQADLGIINFNGLESVVTDYAQNRISFNTAHPEFHGRGICGNALLRGGSFGSYDPSLRMGFRLSDNITMSAYAGGRISRGNFPYGDGEFRANNDIRQIQASIDVFGNISGGKWQAKAYWNGAGRGTPGSTDWPSNDRQTDRNAFIQGTLRKSFTKVYAISLGAKASYDDIGYFGAYGDSRFRQTGFQINSDHTFKVKKWLSLSLTADIQWDGMRSSAADASRTTATGAVAAEFRTKGFKAVASVEYCGYFDSVQGAARNCFSPAAELRYEIIPGLDVIAFARRACRVPTFNELYYPGFGNPELGTETSLLSDVGLHWRKRISEHWSIKLGGDFVYDALRGKIISTPSPDNPSIWLPYNIGKVRSQGCETFAGADFRSGGLQAGIQARYALQDATDITEGGDNFGRQIPYIPRNNLNLSANAAFHGWRAAAGWIMRSGRSDASAPLPDWNRLDLSLAKDFQFKNDFVFGLELKVADVTGFRYELSAGYPMPGRSFTIGTMLKF